MDPIGITLGIILAILFFLPTFRVKKEKQEEDPYLKDIGL